MSKLFDAVMIEIDEPKNVVVMQRGLTEKNADAYVQMAVVRRGTKHHFYKYVPSGTY